jgi:hypothetical protein
MTKSRIVTIDDVDLAIKRRLQANKPIMDSVRDDPDELTLEEKMDRFEPDEMGQEDEEDEEIDDGADQLWNER